MALANFLVNRLLKEYFTEGGPQYVALHVSDPTNAGLADTELSIASMSTYARKAVGWSTPSNRSVVSINQQSWVAMPLVSIGYLGIWDAMNNGNLLAVLTCPTPLRVTNSGGSIYLPEGAIGIRLGGSPGGYTPGLNDDGLFRPLPV